MATDNIARLSNDDLIAETKAAASDERRTTARLVALLAEFDSRRLYLGQGCSSLFAYCTNVLRLSEHAAYHRIEAARAARDYPLILERLADGHITLTAVGLLRPHLTADNHLELLDAVRHQPKREVERLVASLAPRADVRPLVRKIPTLQPLSIRSSTPRSVPPSSPAAAVRTTPIPERPAFALSAETAAGHTAIGASSPNDRYLLRLTIDGETRAKFDRARDLLRHVVPSCDPAAIVDRALTVLIEQLERAKLATTSRPGRSPSRSNPSSTTRYIPVEVRRAVWARDAGRCTFVGAETRCQETGGLEFHHVMPYARGGRTDASNLTLRCRAHNAFEGRKEFGQLGLDRATVHQTTELLCLGQRRCWGVSNTPMVMRFDVTDRRFEIPSSGLADLAITFSDVATERVGVITEPAGGPATDYFVIAIPADRSYWMPGSRRIVSTRPDGTGRYQFSALPAGEYRIALTTDLVPQDLRDTAALERLSAQSVVVNISAGEKKSLDLRVCR